MTDLAAAGDWGNLLAGLGGAVQVWQYVSALRADQAREFLEMLDELLDDPEAAALIANDPVTAEVFAVALPRAAETANSEHRRLLARVVARSLEGPPDDVDVDPRPVYARAASMLDPPHMSGLLALDQPERGADRDAHRLVTGEQLAELLPHLGPLLYPVMHGLEAAGLATPVSTYGGGPTWMLTEFGSDFLRWIQTKSDPDQDSTNLADDHDR